MANTYTTIKTNAGLALEAAAQSGGDKITLTQMAIGDGGGNPVVPDAAQTALVREQVRVTLNAIAPNPDNAAQFTAEAIIPASAGGFTMREAGLYTADGTLFAVANLPQVYKPTSTEGAFGQVVVTMTFVAANAREVNLTVDENVSVATRLWVQNYVIPAHVFAGGTSGQLLAKSSNNDGAWSWVDPTASVHVLVDTIEEDQTLAANQTAITLSTVTTNGLGVFINGVRLRDDEWSKVDDTHITLNQARNSGDRITLLQNEQTGYTDVLRADRNLSDVDDADTSISNLFGGAISVDRSMGSLLAKNTPNSDDNSKQFATTEFVHAISDPVTSAINNSISASEQTASLSDATQLTAAIRKLALTARYDAAFAKKTGGYSIDAIVADSNASGVFWVSTADNNLTTPGASGAAWVSLFNGYYTGAQTDTKYVAQATGNLDFSAKSAGINKSTGSPWFSYIDADGNSQFLFFQPSGDYLTPSSLTAYYKATQSDARYILKAGDTSAGDQNNSNFYTNGTTLWGPKWSSSIKGANGGSSSGDYSFGLWAQQVGGSYTAGILSLNGFQGRKDWRFNEDGNLIGPLGTVALATNLSTEVLRAQQAETANATAAAQASSAATSANNNANGRVAKTGDTMSGPLTTVIAPNLTSNVWNYSPAYRTYTNTRAGFRMFSQDQVNVANTSGGVLVLDWNGSDTQYWWFMSDGTLNQSSKGQVAWQSQLPLPVGMHCQTFSVTIPQGTSAGINDSPFIASLPQGFSTFSWADGCDTGSTVYTVAASPQDNAHVKIWVSSSAHQSGALAGPVVVTIFAYGYF
ncbi:MULTISPECIES: phage tail protein [Asaia]|uniref:phage tail protein n=1 Tax=Asaia TaxID=91914 RepID=UPI002FC2F2B5